MFSYIELLRDTYSQKKTLVNGNYGNVYKKSVTVSQTIYTQCTLDTVRQDIEIQDIKLGNRIFSILCYISKAV